MSYWLIHVEWPPREAESLGMDRSVEYEILAPTKIGAQRLAIKKLDDLTETQPFHSGLVTLYKYSDVDGVSLDPDTAWQISWTREGGRTRWKSRGDRAV